MKAKSSLIVMIPLTSFILLSLLLLTFYMKNLENKYYQTLSQLPVLAYSYNISHLNSLKLIFEKDPSILGTRIETGDELKKNLSEKYDLKYEDILNESRVPHLLVINFKGDTKFDYLNIIQEIRKQSADILIDFNSKKIDQVFTELKQYRQFQSVIFILMIIFSFLVLFYARIFYEQRNNDYWRIYIRAGGNPTQLGKQYIIQSLLILSVSLLLAVICTALINQYMLSSSNTLQGALMNILALKESYLVFMIPVFAFIISYLYHRRVL